MTRSVPTKYFREKKSPRGEFPFQEYHIYGGFGKDGVYRYQLVHKDTYEKLYLSRARYNMCVHLKRILTKDERVEKIDGPSDELDNLKLITPQIRAEIQKANLTKHCVICDSEFVAIRARTKTCSLECKNALKRQSMTGTTAATLEAKCVECGSRFIAQSPRAITCSDRCRYTRKRKLGGHMASDGSYISKPSTNRVRKPKVIKPKETFRNKCEICEHYFTAKTPEQDVCFSHHCQTVLVELGNLDI